jgi:hypothetical protein
VITLSESVRYVGETVVAVHFSTDPDAHADRIPDPLEPIREGEAMALFGQSVVNDPSIIEEHGYLPPRLSNLHESSIILPCELDGDEGYLFTHHHADRDWSVRKFSAMGYDSQLADIRLTRHPPELAEFVEREPGKVVEAKTSTNGHTHMRATVDLESTDVEHPWPSHYGTFGRRRVKDQTIGADHSFLVNDITTETHSSSGRPEMWGGEADLTLHGREFGDLQPHEVHEGFVFDISMEFQGMTVLWEGELD